MPLVSVILTSFNHAKYIREAIESILDQTFDNFELIIIDDNSSDDSWHIIQSYQDKRVIAIQNAHQQRGLYGTNLAISTIAKGKYIAIHHSDDVWEPDKLARQVEFLEANSKYGAIFTWAQIIDEDGMLFTNQNHYYYKIFEQPNRTRHEWLNYFFYHGNALCHPSVLIRKQCYQDVGLYEYGFGQIGDWLMWVKLCMKYEIYVLPEKLIKFRVRSNEQNTSGDRVVTRLRSRMEHFMLLEKYLNIKEAEDFYKIFPNAPKFPKAPVFIPEYHLAMVCLNSFYSDLNPLYGFQLLFRLLNMPDKAKMIEEYYGFTYIDLIRLTGQPIYSCGLDVKTKINWPDLSVLSNGDSLEKVLSGRTANVMIFGTGTGGARAFSYLNEKMNAGVLNIKVSGFLDNDHTKTGGQYCGVTILTPTDPLVGEADFILLASSNYFLEMFRQLIELGITADKIVKVSPSILNQS